MCPCWSWHRCSRPRTRRSTLPSFALQSQALPCGAARFLLGKPGALPKPPGLRPVACCSGWERGTEDLFGSRSCWELGYFLFLGRRGEVVSSPVALRGCSWRGTHTFLPSGSRDPMGSWDGTKVTLVLLRARHTSTAVLYIFPARVGHFDLRREDFVWM